MGMGVLLRYTWILFSHFRRTHLSPRKAKNRPAALWLIVKDYRYRDRSTDTRNETAGPGVSSFKDERLRNHRFCSPMRCKRGQHHAGYVRRSMLAMSSAAGVTS